MVELTQGGSPLMYRPGTSQAHRGPDGLSRNVPGLQGIVLARKRDWVTFRSLIQGIPEALEEEEDEEKYLPSRQEESHLDPHEDLVDNWRLSGEPEREFAKPWTGCTECEKVSDGEWVPFYHEEPRTTLFVPPEEEGWSGRRRTTLWYVAESPGPGEGAGPAGAPMASGGSNEASAKAAAPPASEAPGSKSKARSRSAASKRKPVKAEPVGGAMICPQGNTAICNGALYIMVYHIMVHHLMVRYI